MPRGKSKRCKDCKWFESGGVNWGRCYAPLPVRLRVAKLVTVPQYYANDDCEGFQPRKDRKEEL